MNYLSVDYLIVYAFLIITLVIGLRAGRGIKDIREYALANKMYGTGVLVLTFLATNIGGGSVMSGSREVFTNGIIMTVTSLGVVISLLFVAFFIAPNIVHFEDCITIGDVMGKLYGGASKVITGVLGVLYSICMTSMQLLALTIIGESLLGLKSAYGLIIGGLVLATYSAIGGIKSVAITDVFQFLILVTVFPLIASLSLNRIGGIQELFHKVPAEKFNVFSHENFSYYLTLFLVWSIFPVGITSPPLFQRLLMGQNAKQLRDQYLIVAAFDPTFRVIITLIGLTAVVLYPTIEAKNVIPHIVNELSPAGLKGWAIAGLLAVVMSTADSYLHAAGLLLSHDVIKPLGDKIGIAIHELSWARYSTVIIGCIAIVIALQAENLLRLSFTALSFTGPLLLFPLVAGIMGLKSDRYAFYNALIVTLIAFSLSTALLPPRHHHLAVIISILANGISFLGVHALRNQGFIIVRPVSRIERGELWRLQPKPFVERLINLLPTPKSIIRYSHRKIDKYGAAYILFGTFCCINFTLPYFMWTHEFAKSHSLMTYLRLTGATMCGLLIVRDKWPKSLLPYLPTFWHLTLLYCLPFTSTIMFLLTQGSVEWLINVALTIMFLIVLVDWMSFVILTVLGVALGFLFYTLAIGPIDLQLDFSTGYLLVYQGIFATLIGLLFARRKQLHFDTLATQREQLAIDNQASKEDLLEATEKEFGVVSMLKKAGIGQLESVAHLSKRLLELSKQKGSHKEVTTLAQQLTDQLTPMALHMDRFVHRTTGFLLLDGVEILPLDNFLQAVQQALYDKGHRLKMEVRTQHKTIQCDVEKMKKVILNSVSFMHSVTEEEVAKESLLLSIEDTHLGYSVDSVTPDHIKKIKALQFAITTSPTLPGLAALYMAQIGEESIMQPAVPTNMPLLANERIVRAHYGYSGTIGEGDGLTLLYVIPVNVREVRSKDMDTPQMQLGASWPRADDTYPGAQEQEKVFLQAVRERSKANLTLVEKAINLIKDYHGPIMRESGEPFYLHPMAVAQIVLDYNQEEATLLGALLHDTVEDTPLTLEQVALLFNQEVRTIVQGVTHMESNKATNYKVLLSHPENIHRLLGAEDKRVLYVKLADRVHNLRTIQAKSYESQRRTAEETLLFFVPLAKYLGLTEAAEELKNRSFEVLGR
jgi:Na+/proline symporter